MKVVLTLSPPHYTHNTPQAKTHIHNFLLSLRLFSEHFKFPDFPRLPGGWPSCISLTSCGCWNTDQYPTRTLSRHDHTTHCHYWILRRTHQEVQVSHRPEQAAGLHAWHALRARHGRRRTGQASECWTHAATAHDELSPPRLHGRCQPDAEC